jgi:nucleoside-diphosphate-sugar epimerase
MKSVRLWNVYGYESIGLKSHVLNDWIWSCTARGVIPCTTDGLEYRQFTHADDVASALGAMMANFVVLDEVTDISSGEWVQLRDIGAVAQAAVAQLAEPSAPPCALTFNATRPAAIENSPAQRLRVDPTLDRPFHAAWRAAIGERISLEDGVSRLARVYAASVSAPETPSCAAEDDECAAAPRS